MRAHVLTRDIDATESHGLERPLSEGDIVYVSDTSDADAPLGHANCRLTPNVVASFWLPRSALVEYERTWEQTCYMPHDPRA